MLFRRKEGFNMSAYSIIRAGHTNCRTFRCVTCYDPLSWLIKKKWVFLCQSLPNAISAYPFVSREILWDLRPFTFFQAFFVLRLPFSTRLLYSSKCVKCLEVRGIINASKLHASHTEHEGQYCFSHWDYRVPLGTLAIWSSCYQKSQYLHFVEYACPLVFGKRAIWYLCLYDYLVCIHKILSASPLMIQRQHCTELFHYKD